MTTETGTWDQHEKNAGNVFSYAPGTPNCTIKPFDPACVCSGCNENGCYIKCYRSSYFCVGYTKCWSKDWSLITATQISVFILFVLGIVSVIIMYLRVCNRIIQRAYSNRAIPQSERNDQGNPNMSQISIIENRDRPPSYSEACSAPPLYSSPYNRVSMLEPPPVYPETPKLSERNSPSNNPTVEHHI